MSDFYAAIAPSGTRALASHDGAKQVRFNAEPWIPMPTHCNALAIAPDGSRMLVRGRNDRVYRVLRNGIVIDLDSAAGTHSVGFGPLGREYWIRSTREYLSGGVVLPVPKDSSGQYIGGQGWTQIKNEGPAWTDQSGTRIIEGRQLNRCVDVPWFGVVGMDTRVDRILAYRTADRSWWIVWTGHTDIGPCAAMVNGQVVVAIGPPGLFVNQSQFTRTTLTPTPPPHDNPNDTPMTSAEYIDLRDRLKRIDAKLEQVLDALDELPQAPSDDDEIPPPAPEMPTIPVEVVTWTGKANPLGFAVTSRISDVTIRQKPDDDESFAPGDNYEVCFPHSKAGEWPELTNAEGKHYEGNVCVFARINGRWYGDTAEWLKVNQFCKRFSNLTAKESWGIGVHTKHEPMESWGPKSGEWFGLMVCTPVRSGKPEGPVQERSQIFVTRWP